MSKKEEPLINKLALVFKVISVAQIVFVINKITNAGDIAKWTWVQVLAPSIFTIALFVIAVVILAAAATKGGDHE